MRRTAARLVIPSVVLVGVSLWTACGKSGGGGGGGEEPQVTQLTPESDAEGAVTAAVSAGSPDTLVLSASASSSINGASISFPPGSLGSDAKVTIEPGVSLKNSTLESELGLDQKAIELQEVSGAVVVSSVPEMNAASPFTIALPIPAQSLVPIDLAKLVVVFKELDVLGQILELGVLPPSSFTVEGNTVFITTTRFGSFQVMLSSEVITEVIKIITSSKIETIRGTTEPGPGPDPQDTTAPAFTKPLVDVLLTNGSFKIVYNESLAKASVKLAGSLGTTSKAVVSKTNKDDDTITVSPKTSWSSGAPRAITVNVNDLAGNAAAEARFSIEIVDKIFYVRTDGDDDNAGTQAAPFKTLSHAAGMAADGDLRSYIYVAKGTYAYVTISPGVRLVGGFPLDSWTTRSLKGNVTRIDASGGNTGVTFTSGLAKDTTKRVALATETLLKGFHITTPDTEENYATTIEVYGGDEAVIAGNVIQMNGEYGSAIEVSNESNATIIDNEISINDGLTDQGNLIKILGLQKATAAHSVEVARNRLKMVNASGVNMHGVLINSPDGTANVHDNVIEFRTSSGSTRAIDIYGSRAIVRNNTIFMDTTGFAVGIYAGGGAFEPELVNDNVVENNILHVTGTPKYCIQANAVLAGQFASVKNNVFRGCVDSGSDSSIAIFEYSGTEIDTIAALNMSSIAAANLGSDPVFNNAATGDFSLKANSTLFGKGINGKNANWSFPSGYVDFTGKPRGSSWTVGAYQ